MTHSFGQHRYGCRGGSLTCKPYDAGDILTVQGNRETNKVNCTNCRSQLTFINDERSLVLSGDPPPAKGKDAKKPATQGA